VADSATTVCGIVRTSVTRVPVYSRIRERRVVHIENPLHILRVNTPCSKTVSVFALIVARIRARAYHLPSLLYRKHRGRWRPHFVTRLPPSTRAYIPVLRWIRCQNNVVQEDILPTFGALDIRPHERIVVHRRNRSAVKFIPRHPFPPIRNNHIILLPYRGVLLYRATRR